MTSPLRPDGFVRRVSSLPGLDRALPAFLDARPPGAAGIGHNSASLGQMFDEAVNRTCRLPTGYLSPADRHDQLILPVSPDTVGRIHDLAGAIEHHRAQRPLSPIHLDALVNADTTFGRWRGHYETQRAHAIDHDPLAVSDSLAGETARESAEMLRDLACLAEPFRKVSSAVGHDLMKLAERGGRR